MAQRLICLQLDLFDTSITVGMNWEIEVASELLGWVTNFEFIISTDSKCSKCEKKVNL